jgi:hypothetical protein
MNLKISWDSTFKQPKKTGPYKNRRKSLQILNPLYIYIYIYKILSKNIQHNSFFWTTTDGKKYVRNNNWNIYSLHQYRPEQTIFGLAWWFFYAEVFSPRKYILGNHKSGERVWGGLPYLTPLFSRVINEQSWQRGRGKVWRFTDPPPPPTPTPPHSISSKRE